MVIISFKRMHLKHIHLLFALRASRNVKRFRDPSKRHNPTCPKLYLGYYVGIRTLLCSHLVSPKPDPSALLLDSRVTLPLKI